MAECGKYVGQGAVTWPCVVEVVGGSPHDGPCMARENIRSVQLRKQWEGQQPAAPVITERVSTRVDPNPHPRSELRNLPTDRPVTLADLGMQGPPKSAVDGLLQEEQREGRRLHPAEARRQTRIEQGLEDDIETPEAQLARTAGGVPISPVVVPEEGTPPPNYAALDREVWAVRTTEDDGEEVLIEDEGRSEDEVVEITSHLAPSEMKTRPEDQVLPTVSDRPFIQDLLIEDIEGRRAVGVQRYGTPLQGFNERNSDRDLYEELLDAATYCRQRLYEREQAAIWVNDLAEVLGKYFIGGLPTDVSDLLARLALAVV